MRLVRPVAAMLVVALSCGGTETEPVEAERSLDVTSAAFSDGSEIPIEHTCDGTDLSPALEWSGVDGESYVVTMIDPDAGDFVHWVLFSIPGSVSELEQGRVPNGAIEGATDLDGLGYGGPCPPPGDGPHHTCSRSTRSSGSRTRSCRRARRSTRWWTRSSVASRGPGN